MSWTNVFLKIYILGDAELIEHIDGLLKEPEKFAQPYPKSSGEKNETEETILHFIAKEGKVEIMRDTLRKIQNAGMEKHMVEALLTKV